MKAATSYLQGDVCILSDPSHVFIIFFVARRRLQVIVGFRQNSYK